MPGKNVSYYLKFLFGEIMANKNYELLRIKVKDFGMVKDYKKHIFLILIEMKSSI